eukprot:TRINITY_DN14773_c0_g1_i2.p1 TRINITY_DN14773_c0_g1~~TRINITY_DN14773_c0_g1_i2.p1  ORF type:complete len:173 (-),score=35.37 TRINITY_DN14773_c0_g1_i2:588-1106(-)
MTGALRSVLQGATRSVLRTSRLSVPTAAFRPVTPLSFCRLSFPARAFADVRFAETHEWFKADGDTATVGISDFAQGQLGEVVYVELPEVGTTFKAKDTICTLESVKAVGEVYAPVDCEITEVNSKLDDEPATVNSSPEKDGWLVKIKYTGDAASLMDRAAYDKHLEAEAKKE